MKKNIYMLLVISLIVPFIQKPTQVEALSCLYIPPYVATITGESSNQYREDSIFFDLSNIIGLEDTSINSIPRYKEIYSQYISNTIPNEIIYNSFEDEDLDEDITFSLPDEITDNISKGDIVVVGAPYSVSACGGPGVSSIFDNQGNLKLMYFSSFKYDTSIFSYAIMPIPVGSLEDNTKVEFIGSDDNNFSLKVGEKKILENKDTIYLLNIKNKTDDIWFGDPYISFAIEINSQTVIVQDLCSINYSRLIRFGRSGEDVRQTQQCLNNLGYNTGKTDGIYGPNTSRGIREFQMSENIKVDGIVGPQTVSYLNRK